MSESNFTNLTCEQVRDYLDSYVSDELRVETYHAIERHLDSCPACSAELAAMQRVRQLVQRAVQQETASDLLRARIKNDLCRSRPPRALSLVTNRLFPNAKAGWTLTTAAAAAAVLVLCLGTWGAITLWNERKSVELALQVDSNHTLPEQTAKLLRLGVSDHIHCAIDNGLWNKFLGFSYRSLRSEYAGLLPLVREKVGEDFEVIAAHHCTAEKREFVHLILKNNETLVSLAITKKSGETFPVNNRRDSLNASGASLHTGHTESFEVVGFETETHLAYVVSNLRYEENLQLASHIAPTVSDFLARL